jgi:hypothetical protein
MKNSATPGAPQPADIETHIANYLKSGDSVLSNAPVAYDKRLELRESLQRMYDKANQLIN